MSDARRSAADARRLIRTETGELDRGATKRIRTFLKQAYDRGRLAGREERELELPNANVRASLLQVSITVLEGMEAQVSAIPNHDHATRAFREAAAVLRDAQSQEEALPPVLGDAMVATREEVAGIAEAVGADTPAKKPARKKPAQTKKRKSKVKA